jgi:single-strand DNA-binding protein
LDGPAKVHAQPNNRREDRQIVYDTPIVVVGNVLTAPEWRRTIKSNTLVANFRVASTSRRYDRDNNRWVDGDTLRVRVNCWRRLAENVGASVAVGDPIVVVGRLYTRDWVDSENNPRTSYEVEAMSVGHDLARGRTRLFRTRPASVTSAEGPDTDGVVRGEAAETVPDQPVILGDGIDTDATEPQFTEQPPSLDPVTAVLGGGGFEPFEKETTPKPGDGDDDPEPPAPGSPSAPAPAPEVEIEVERLEEEVNPRRPRRNRRQPIPA